MSDLATLSSVPQGFALLKGQSNFSSWYRDSTQLVRTRDLNQFCDQAYVLPPEPKKSDYVPDRSSKRIQIANTAENKDAAYTVSDLSFRLQEYKFDLDEWRRTSLRYRALNSLIINLVDPSIRSDLLTDENDTPAKKVLYLKSQYRMQKARALDLYTAQIESLKLSDFPNVQEYLNKHVNLKADIEAAGGSYSTSLLISKIIRGLTSRYNTFVD